MSEPRKFTIRKVNSPDKSSPPPSQPTPAKPKKTPQPAANAATGGYFRSANGVLGFLGSVFGTQLSNTAIVRHNQKGNWWVEVEGSHQQITPLIWTAGGKPFLAQNQQWMALSASGNISTPTQATDFSTWQMVDLAELLASVRLPASSYQGAQVINVVTPGSLGRWILRQAITLDLNVTITPAHQQPLHSKTQEPSGVLLIRLQTPAPRTIPAAFVSRLTRLPYTSVTAPLFDSDAEKLFVDVRQRLPLTPSLVEPMIPENEVWVLGTADVGNWRLHTTGQAIDGSLLLDAPPLPTVEPSSVANAKLPNPIAVQLVPRPRASQRVDAVLLDDTELGWVGSWLRRRPVGDIAFLLPGAGYHLVTAPGGLPTQLPLGIPLVWIGPGSLYLELGMDFYPGLPNIARQQRFNLTPEAVVVVARQQTYRFTTAQILPAWTLWVGEIPQVKTGLSKPGKMLLNRISQQLQPTKSRKGLGRIVPVKSEPSKPIQEVDILAQAQDAELRGDLETAAALLEKGGYSAQAGQLYERMAKRRH